jgi:hypothetical protein
MFDEWVQCHRYHSVSIYLCLMPMCCVVYPDSNHLVPGRIRMRDRVRFFRVSATKFVLQIFVFIKALIVSLQADYIPEQEHFYL